MKGGITGLMCLAMSLLAQAQTYRLSKWHVPAANYSGITPVGDGQYAVVSDEEDKVGFYLWKIDVDEKLGRVKKVENLGFRGAEWPEDRDAEGIAYCEQRGTLFVSGETDQRILEHTMDGKLTGRELAVPQGFGIENIHPNRGFEALGYDPGSGLFWTCTESALKTDTPLHLRMLTFGTDLRPLREYGYVLDSEQARNHGRDHYHGVVAITPLGNGKLLVLEREARIAPRYNGSRCWCKLFEYDPSSGLKRLLDSWKTKFSVTNTRMANFEGMCLGPMLADGRRMVFLVSDSQAGYGRGPWRLHDWLRVITLPAD